MEKNIPWFEANILDVGVDVAHKCFLRKKEIVMKSPMTSPALIMCLNSEGTYHSVIKDAIEKEFDRQCELVLKQKKFNYGDYIKFDEMIHDMSFLRK